MVSPKLRVPFPAAVAAFRWGQNAKTARVPALRSRLRIPGGPNQSTALHYGVTQVSGLTVQFYDVKPH